MNDQFNDASVLDALCQDLLYSDYQRGLRRALINRLFNGVAPYTKEEQAKNHINVNFNDLTGPRLAHEARSQFTNRIMTPGQYFNARTDWGAAHKRDIYAATVTGESNGLLKNDVGYFEAKRSSIAQLVLHGISPAAWENRCGPIPCSIGVEDVLIPSNTLLGFKNLPIYVLRRSFTKMELGLMTMRAKRDPGWNMDLVCRVMEWLGREMTTMQNPQTSQFQWSPEKCEEMFKQDGGLSGMDQCPTVDCFDIYLYSEGDEKTPSGWLRRIIMDGFERPPAGAAEWTDSRRTSMKDRNGADLSRPGNDDFLFTSGDETVGDTWQNLITFQYADLSAVAPFRYHSVRSLGWMTYAQCHVQNRLKCKIMEAGFEALMQYFKVNSLDDVQRALKLELVNMGFIDETIKPVPASERYQAPWGGIEYVAQMSQAGIDQSSKSWTQDLAQSSKQTEKTRFQVQAEVQAMNALVAAGLQQYDEYAKFEYREIFRRFMLKDNRDPQARTFRANCYRRGVPEKLMVPEAWDIQPEKMMGGGNQTLEGLMAQQLMSIVNQLDPDAQRVVRRKTILAWTHDSALAEQLVPVHPKISDTVHDTEGMFATLMRGIAVEPKDGLNAGEVAASMIKMMQAQLQIIAKFTGNVGTPQDSFGLKNCARYAGVYIQHLAQDLAEKENAKKLGDALGKVLNMVKAMDQRQAEMAKKAQAQQQNGNGGIDPKTMAQVKGKLLLDTVKARSKTSADAQKLRHKEIHFRQGLHHEQIKTAADIAKTDLETAANIRRGGMKSFDEGGGE